MVSKVAQIREEMGIAQDLTKAHILFVAIPVLNEEDHKKLQLLQASRALQLSGESSPLGEQSE
ncbi:hypothetical protein [Ochrobactrum sp. EDr1-4]|uniref:hypothetical protein n=1 Tax=Ochrobactrum sp. EDr1-4 TaxID=3368622 RepID=UPI003B9FBEE1